MHFDNLQIDQMYHLIGDSAYLMSNFLMAPCKARGVKLTEVQKKFNTHLSSKCAVIERGFGLLGLRFPRVTDLPFRSNDKCTKCIVACCVCTTGV